MDYFEQLHNGVRIFQPDACFKIGTDSILVADFLTLRPGVRVADLGSGTGNIAFLLTGRSDTCHITGIELQRPACDAAHKTIRFNALEDRVCIIQADLRQIRDHFPSGSFQAAVSNPPYFPSDSGKAAEDSAIADARSERTCSLHDVCAAAAWLLRTGGNFALVHRPERLCDLMYELRSCGLEPKRMRFVRHNTQSRASLVLLESKRGGKPGLKLENDFILFEPDGRPSPEYRRVYHLDGNT